MTKLEIRKLLRKNIACGILAAFFINSVVAPAGGQILPVLNGSVSLSRGYQPPLLLGLKIHPENPLLFDFIVDQGEAKLSTDELKQETTKLVKYFLAALTIPDKEVWVNLSPTEKDRIIPDVLGQTTMGKTMLEQDYVLKQLASSLTNPETDLGKKYWDNVNVNEGSIAVGAYCNTPLQNKVWIMPDKAEVLENNGIVLVGEKRLKVMLDEEYQAVGAYCNTPLQKNVISSQIFRTTILPEINRQVNESRDFADVRQIYNSVILAAWYKKALKESLLGKIYADKGKVLGVETNDKEMKHRIYEQYLEAFKKGAYNLIKEEEDENGDLIPRKYFSGGIADLSEKVIIRDGSAFEMTSIASSGTVIVDVALEELGHTVRNVFDGFSGRRSALDSSLAFNPDHQKISYYGVEYLLSEVIGVLEEVMNYSQSDAFKENGFEFSDVALNPEKMVATIQMISVISADNLSARSNRDTRHKLLLLQNIIKQIKAQNFKDFKIGVRVMTMNVNDSYQLLIFVPKNNGLTAEKMRALYMETILKLLRRELDKCRDFYKFPELLNLLERNSQKLSDNNETADLRGILSESPRFVKFLNDIVRQISDSLDDQQDIFNTAQRNPPTTSLIKTDKAVYITGRSVHIKIADISDIDQERQELFLNSLREYLSTKPVAVLKVGGVHLMNDLSVAIELIDDGILKNIRDEVIQQLGLKPVRGTFIANVAHLYGEGISREQLADLSSKLEKMNAYLKKNPMQILLSEVYRAISIKDGIEVVSLGAPMALSASSQLDGNSSVLSGKPVGGIDFDPTNMNLQIKRDGRGVPLPLPQQNIENINLDGLFPVIINIVPINAQTLPVFLGQAPKEPAREPQLAGSIAG